MLDPALIGVIESNEGHFAIAGKIEFVLAANLQLVEFVHLAGLDQCEKFGAHERTSADPFEKTQYIQPANVPPTIGACVAHFIFSTSSAHATAWLSSELRPWSYDR